MIISSPPVFYLVPAHPIHPTESRPRGGNFNRRAQRLLKQGPSRARLGLDRWGKLCWPEPGLQALFSSRSVWWTVQLWS